MAGHLQLGGELKTGTKVSIKMLKAEWTDGPKKVLELSELGFED